MGLMDAEIETLQLLNTVLDCLQTLLDSLKGLRTTVGVDSIITLDTPMRGILASIRKRHPQLPEEYGKLMFECEFNLGTMATLLKQRREILARYEQL